MKAAVIFSTSFPCPELPTSKLIAEMDVKFVDTADKKEKKKEEEERNIDNNKNRRVVANYML